MTPTYKYVDLEAAAARIAKLEEQLKQAEWENRTHTPTKWTHDDLIDVDAELDRLGAPRLQSTGLTYNPVGRLRKLTASLVGEFYAATLDRLRAENDRLRSSLAIFVHTHQTGNSVPPHLEAQARDALKPPTEAKQ